MHRVEIRYRLEKRLDGGRNWELHYDSTNLRDIEIDERWLLRNGWDTQIFKYEVVTCYGAMEKYRSTNAVAYTGR